MSNEITVPDGDPMKALQLAAMNINGLSQQMGLVVARMDAQDQRIARVEEDFITIKAEQTITRAQCRRIRKAVMNRVNEVLKIEFEGGRVADGSIVTDQLYRGGFISRLYTDAKNHSKMGESYTETLKVDFGAVIDYIESWVPEVDGGVEGYKHYLDIRREERMKKSD